jgi:hypothetical protein
MFRLKMKKLKLRNGDWQMANGSILIIKNIPWQVPKEAHIKSNGFGPALVPPGKFVGSSTSSANPPGRSTLVETPEPASFDVEP